MGNYNLTGRREKCRPVRMFTHSDVPVWLSDVPVWLSDVPVWLSEIPVWLSEIPVWLSEIPVWLSEIPVWLSEIPIYLLGTSKIELLASMNREVNANFAVSLGRGSVVAPKAVLCRLYLAFADGGKNGAIATHEIPRPLLAAFFPLAAKRGRPQKKKNKRLFS
ncbi:MAG: hypothetical protein WCL14_03070 [Bacteroidota bacterium]